MSKQKTITVVGIGYVGLPLACLAASKGYKVWGLDINKELVEKVNRQQVPFTDELVTELLPQVVKGSGAGSLQATTNPAVIKKSEAVIVCVPTPVDEKYLPDFAPLVGATEMIVKQMSKGTGQLVVVESTINPGVCEEIVLPIFEQAGLRVGRDFFLAHAPERINPGDPKWNVRNLARNVGAVTKTGLKKAVELYEDIIEAPINPMKSIKAAEATKTIENAFRDINIAFINEIAKSFDQLGIDVTDVIKGASSKFSFMPHYPSCGVGGHCIPVDPYYLIQKAEAVGFSHDFLKLARRINNGMPHYAVELLQDELNKLKLPLKKTRVGVLGVAYKANIDDTRESPSFEIIKLLKDSGAEVLTFDPFVRRHSSEKSLESLLKKAETVLVTTNHDEFVRELTGENLKKHKIKLVLDGKNCLDKEAILKAGVFYKGIGR